MFFYGTPEGSKKHILQEGNTADNSPVRLCMIPLGQTFNAGAAYTYNVPMTTNGGVAGTMKNAKFKITRFNGVYEEILFL
jgi:hypothetical protein